ncbi:MAG: methyltransferase domain-containing protein [Pseudanabaenaceae cyanobacterium bins.39]|nr:methyltransferase domain-containing protein [Pseudanabaenaceae cyanobacterium bins.39]
MNSIITAFYKLLTLGLSKGAHITRYSMYRHISKYSELRSGDLKVLSISNSENLAKLIGFTDEQITNVSYPEVNILHLPFQDQEFDAVVSDQVLEHIEGDPHLAINETFRVLKPHGIALHTTCFINPVHGCPNDYWRFTPDALNLLVKPHADILDVGGWGNLYAWPFILLGLRHEPIPNARWHPFHWIATHNDLDWPIVTWILARKPSA